MSDLKENFTRFKVNDEYKSVGAHSFVSKILPNVISPCFEFPSFKWLNVVKFEYDEIWVNKVKFKQV